LPVITGYNFKRSNPGAHDPGFTLAPASQADETFEAKPEDVMITTDKLKFVGH